jgi:hypothetical protein
MISARQTLVSTLSRERGARFSVGDSRCRKTFSFFCIFSDISTSGFLNVYFYKSSRIQSKESPSLLKDNISHRFPLTTTDREEPLGFPPLQVPKPLLASFLSFSASGCS